MLRIDELEAWVCSERIETLRPGVRPLRGDVALDGERPKPLFFRGVADAMCRTVDTR